MTTLNKNTKKAQAFINAYNNSSARSLNDVYSSYSNRKQTSYDEIYLRFIKDNISYDFRIISASSNFYTTAYRTIINGRLCLIVDTYANTYIIYLED